MARTSLMTLIFFVAAGLQDDGELGLLLDRGSRSGTGAAATATAAAADTPHFSSSNLASSAASQHGELREIVDDFCEIGHG